MRRDACSTGLAALLVMMSCAVLMTAHGCTGTKPTTAQTIERYSQKLRDAVAREIPQEQRKAQMLSIVDRVEALHLRFGQETVDFVQSYRKLNADYDAARPALDHLFSDYEAKRIRARNEALDLHFQLAALATTSEWDAIGKAEEKLYEEVNAARPREESAN